MKKGIFLLFAILQISCTDISEYDIALYHEITNQAELAICDEDYGKASNDYASAFENISKPFGHDLFNAVLVNQLVQKTELRDEYLKLLINNLDDLSEIEEVLIRQSISIKSFNKLASKRKNDFDVKLRNEFKEIEKRDQRFRPMYDTYDDTINANRIINMNRILFITDSIGYPSHIELGYKQSLIGQRHDIVLLHTAERRSTDKDILDLETLLNKAVKEGRLDPESAIFLISMQNDREKEAFEVYETMQLNHFLLPDSLNNKTWIRNLDESEIAHANDLRRSWNADILEDILVKTDFVANTELPFLFTSVRTTKLNLREDFDLKMALDQYSLGTSGMKAYGRKKDGD